MNKESTEDFWREQLVANCKTCGGRGVLSDPDQEDSITLCKCSRMVRQFVKMNDPIHGLHPKYHKFKIDNIHIAKDSFIDLKKYLRHVECKSPKNGYKNPYRNLVISGGQSSGKSSVAAIVYKKLMMREYSVSMFRYSELVALSRTFMSNSQAFNERRDLYNLLKYEDFIIVEDVDRRGHSGNANFEKLGYALFDDIFSYRANHPKKATIITTGIDIDKNLLTHETLGSAYYCSIFQSQVEDNEVFKINVKES
jgi:hypothetical protein